MDQPTIFNLIREHLYYLEQEYGVERIGVFGSVARGQETDDSDVDIVVKLREPIGFKFLEFVEFLEKILGKKVDVLTEEGVKNIRIQEISREIQKSVVYV